MIEIKQGNDTLYQINGFTFSEAEMGDSTITLTLSIPIRKEIVSGSLVDVFAPSFSKEWFVSYKGERFYLTTTKPEGTKSISSLSYEYSLIFDSERSDLKTRMIRDLASLGNDTFVSQGQVFNLYANLVLFFDLIQKNLTDCFGSKWVVDINENLIPDTTKLEYNMLTVSNSFIWDLLLKTYEYYGVRWKIVSGTTMTIKVGYEADEISHIFQYGDTTGLTKITRATTASKAVNRLRGTGGTRNLPTNYFTNRYIGFPVDPNPIAGLFSFKNILPKCFRDSVIAGVSFVDYVQKDLLVADFGIIEDGIAPNELIYPSIEGVYKNGDGDYVDFTSIDAIGGIGRIDEIIWAETIAFDDPLYKPDSIVAGVECKADVYDATLSESTIDTVKFSVSENKDISCKINLSYIDQFENIVAPTVSEPYTFKDKTGIQRTVSGSISNFNVKVSLVDATDDSEISFKMLSVLDIDTTTPVVFANTPIGEYKIRVATSANGIITYGDLTETTATEITTYNVDEFGNPTFEYDGDGNKVYTTTGGSTLVEPTSTTTTIALKWSASAKLTEIIGAIGTYNATFDIWVKDIGFDLNAIDPIYHLLLYAGTSDAVISFKNGMLSGYDFTIAKSGNAFACSEDTSKSLNGVASKYRITLIKNDTEFQAGKLMLPNTVMNAVPNATHPIQSTGDQFTILNIQMPQSYVEMAESRVQNYLENQLDILSKEYPTYTIEILDSFIQKDKEYVLLHGGVAIADQLRTGNLLRVSDDRLISGDISLYINNVSIDEKGLLSKYTIAVTDKVTVSGSTVQRIQAQVDVLSTGLSSATQSASTNLANLDSRYLRKTIEDVAYEPIMFKKGVVATTIKTDNFNQGAYSGTGMGIYKDLDGSTMLEIDKLIVRKEALFNDVVINQIKFQGGIMVNSAATMEVSKVESLTGSHTLYFDMKGGSVQNQFALHDIVRCQRMISGLISKYYSAVVYECGLDYIVINDDSFPTNYDGSGTPDAGDVVVQYGNVDNTSRQAFI